jgi:hypothetical protein
MGVGRDDLQVVRKRHRIMLRRLDCGVLAAVADHTVLYADRNDPGHRCSSDTGCAESGGATLTRDWEERGDR